MDELFNIIMTNTLQVYRYVLLVYIVLRFCYLVFAEPFNIIMTNTLHVYVNVHVLLVYIIVLLSATYFLLYPGLW